MSASITDNCIGFPRVFSAGPLRINSYKLFLCIGIYVGSLATAALADGRGFSPSRVGFAAMACALTGLIGARVYHLLVHARAYWSHRTRGVLWNTRRGGWSVFGALLTFVPASVAAARVVDLPLQTFWDLLGIGVLAGGFWIRLGCVFNGCCAGRETSGAFFVRLHDTRGVRKRRIPVQFLEMAWWVLGTAVFVWQWQRSFPPGSFGIGVLGWYGLGRFFLEPLRECPDIVWGRVRINQVVAGVLALGAGGVLALRLWRA
jgi:phosphatidylglycerol:prolipoprotein diacylglycerol transferase